MSSDLQRGNAARAPRAQAKAYTWQDHIFGIPIGIVQFRILEFEFSIFEMRAHLSNI